MVGYPAAMPSDDSTPPLAGLVQPFLAACREQGVADGATLVLAVSGGPDSVALLHLAVRAAAAARWHLRVAHLDHGLRPESVDDARFVAAAASALGLPVDLRRTDVAAIAAERGAGLEEAGRVARYAYFGELLAAAPTSAMAMTAHTLDDQAETVLLHLARGSGLAGLTGIAARRGQVVRPLLGMRRAALRRALDAEGIAYRLDASNADRRFARNRARADLVPLLEALHPGAATAVARSARLVAADAAALEELAATHLAARREPGGWLAWASPPPLAIARRVLRLAIGNPFPPAERIDALLAAATRDEGGRTIQLGGGRRAVIRHHRLRIEDDR